MLMYYISSYLGLINVPLSMIVITLKYDYHNDPKFSDGQVLENSADPDQTAPRAIPSASFGRITL